MALTPTEPAPTEPIDERKYWLAKQQFALDNSWPRKWGTTVVSIAVPLTVAIIGFYSNEQSKIDALSSLELAEKHKVTDENRSALELYLKYMSGKVPDGQDQRRQIEAISSLSNDTRFRQILLNQSISLQPKDTTSGGSSGQAPSEILSGTTNTNLKQPAAQPADFTTYIQYYDPRSAEAQTVAGTLEALNYAVPGRQAMDERHSPAHNQIRIYRAEQRNVAQKLAAQLQQKTGLAFAVVGPIGSNLPDGVLEIWLGKTN